MTGTKTVAERLREITYDHVDCPADVATLAIGSGAIDCAKPCPDCTRKYLDKLADAIEAEQRSKTEQNGVDVDALLKLEDTFCHWAEMAAENNDACQKISVGMLLDIAKRIRDAVKGAKPQLPEGVIWPRFEDNELVNFGDEFVSWDGETHKVRTVEIFSPEVDHDYAINSHATHNFVGGKKSSHGEFVKRPEPEVLDADNVPIKVGDTVYWTRGGNAMTVKRIVDDFVEIEESIGLLFPERLTHRKPDTHGDIEDDATLPPKEYCNRHQLLGADSAYFDDAEATTAMCWHLIDRTRKLLGGD